MKNPQSNVIVEPYHASMGNALQTMLHISPTANENDANKIVDKSLSQCVHAS